jgi:metal-responsive CopG/Arc/MetJ family transcriptional regulator
MSRITKTFTISLSPEMAQEVEQVRHEEHRTRSELVREALRHYFRARIVRPTDADV